MLKILNSRTISKHALKIALAFFNYISNTKKKPRASQRIPDRLGHLVLSFFSQFVNVAFMVRNSLLKLQFSLAHLLVLYPTPFYGFLIPSEELIDILQTKAQLVSPLSCIIFSTWFANSPTPDI